MLRHLIYFISPQHEHRLLGLVLISLHLIIISEIFSNELFFNVLLRIFIIIHFVIFAWWQPLWGRLNPPHFPGLIILMVIGIIFIVFPHILLITLWQIILLALLGGRDLSHIRDRVINVVAIIFLILELVIINIPHLITIQEWVLLNQTIPTVIHGFYYGLISIPMVFLLVSTDNNYEFGYHIDFFHGLTFAMLIIIMILGNLTLVSYAGVNYPLALFQICLFITLFIFTMSWLWLAFTGEENVDQLWTRHLLNIGNTFEQWLDHLAQPNNYRNLTPQEFLHAGFEQLVTLPWISGIAWQSLYGENTVGKEDNHSVTIIIQSLEVKVYARSRISGSQYFHIKIFIQLLEYFHQAKRREAAFAQQMHLQAIHETGAKLTHDIKNLLQSLHAITSVIETYPPNQFGDTQRLLQGQMPHLTQRLKRTLDKLQKPAEFSYSHIPVSLWWGNLKARYRKSNIEFFSDTDTENVLIPEDLFDNVSENLLQNALTKRKREPALHIKVELHISKRHVQFTVCDDGSPIPDEIYSSLLTQPVSSRDGFGIGLYQAVKQLAHTGYSLNIIDNAAGQVCFELASTE